MKMQELIDVLASTTIGKARRITCVWHSTNLSRRRLWTISVSGRCFGHYSSRRTKRHYRGGEMPSMFMSMFDAKPRFVEKANWFSCVFRGKLGFEESPRTKTSRFSLAGQLCTT